MAHNCKDGVRSEKATHWINDGRGIPLCKVCEDCEETKLARYNPAVLGHYNEPDVDEPIEDDGYDCSDVYGF